MRKKSVYYMRVILRLFEDKKKPDRAIIRTPPPPTKSVKYRYPMGQK